MSDYFIDESAIDQCFPMPQYRPFQKEIIQSIIRSINAGFKYIIAECPTGSGKSPIAVTLAKMVNPEMAYYITTTKMLQDQIEADFGSVVTLKGRNAYPCTVYQNFPRQLQMILGQEKWAERNANPPQCDEGYCKTDTTKSGCKMCLPPMEEREENMFPDGNEFSFCPYFEQFYSAVNAQTASMNFNNFILHLNFGGKFQKRRVLIIDEAHNTEEKLLNFLECTVSSGHISTEIPKLDSAKAYEKWLTGIKAVEILKGKLEEARENNRIKDVKLYEGLIHTYVTMMLELRANPDGWVFEWEKDDRIDTTKVVLKPIFVHGAADKFLFDHADIVIFLSATILNAKTFAHNLGIEEGTYTATRIPSTFPVANRPIALNYAGRFVGGKSKMDQWIGKMADRVTEIANRYPHSRGIIHTHSFGIQKALMENLPRQVSNRVIQQFDYNTKTEMLAEHAKNPRSIIAAPAMHEGVDLKDDLSRFQILCKVPYANFYENKQLEARMELDRSYYDYITILKIVQSVGRSVRSAEDWADTFIIDEAFDRIYNGNRSSFPEWFKEAVTYAIPEPRVLCDLGIACPCTPETGCQKLIS